MQTVTPGSFRVVASFKILFIRVLMVYKIYIVEVKAGKIRPQNHCAFR